MKWSAALIVVLLSAGACVGEEGWISLFDGRSLEGWKAGENASTFSVVDGAIVAHGPRSHLFYVGPVQDHSFKNFELKADVMTTPGSNSGIYFHTNYQQSGWPRTGFECQVNNTHRDPKRTGSLYNVKNVRQTTAKDNQWFVYHITVNGKRVVIRIDGKVVVDYAEPDDTHRLSNGTFALQGHDPRSKVYYKNILVKPLAD